VEQIRRRAELELLRVRSSPISQDDPCLTVSCVHHCIVASTCDQALSYHSDVRALRMRLHPQKHICPIRKATLPGLLRQCVRLLHNVVHHCCRCFRTLPYFLYAFLERLFAFSGGAVRAPAAGVHRMGKYEMTHLHRLCVCHLNREDT